MANQAVEEVTARAGRNGTIAQFIGIGICIIAYVGCAFNPRSGDDAVQVALFGFSLFLYGRLSWSIAALGSAISQSSE